MPRKPRVRSRHSISRPGLRRSSGTSGSMPHGAGPARRSDPEVFCQCQSCGAPVESQFGVGDDSWCPSCQAVGTVAGMYGQFPSPPLYGAWAARQARQKEQAKAEKDLTELLRRHRSLANNKEKLMKRTKTHTGTFHCPSCFIEIELVSEESLKCDKCKGPLAEGSLDEIWADEEE